jgi:hypothetical protein
MNPCSEVLGMWRWWLVAAAGLALACLGSIPAAASSGASGVSVKVTPDHDLVGGQAVTVSGRVEKGTSGSSQTWFVAECTAVVRGRMNPSTDTPHCDITDAQALRVGRNGAFAAHFRVKAGIIGDGYCGTPGHTTCVIGVGTAQGLGTVVKVSFASPAPAATATT